MVFQNPRPPFPEILHYYTESYEPFRTVGTFLMRRLRQALLENPRISRYRRLSRNFVGPVRVLDVGCGQGDLLATLAQSNRFLCEGVEPVAIAVEIARKRGLKIR